MEQLTKYKAVATSQEAVQNQNEPQLRDENAFFFSSRRRHTSSYGDWSSDVCSPDLVDRSLNGVFVNGTRVDGRTLDDGDEIIVGRYRLVFVSIPGNEADVLGGGSHDTRLHSVG